MEKVNRLTDSIHQESIQLRKDASKYEKQGILLQKARFKRELAKSLENILGRMVNK